MTNIQKIKFPLSLLVREHEAKIINTTFTQTRLQIYRSSKFHSIHKYETMKQTNTDITQTRLQIRKTSNFQTLCKYEVMKQNIYTIFTQTRAQLYRRSNFHSLYKYEVIKQTNTNEQDYRYTDHISILSVPSPIKQKLTRPLQTRAQLYGR